ncbi:MAG TPA: UDP binding domain-containing protein [Chloroflexota bacterium]
MSTSPTARRTVDALLAQEASIGVWGCGHIGASAMYHFSLKGVRSIGFDIADTRVQEIRQGRFLSTDVVPSGRLEASHDNVTATTDWRTMKAHRVAAHIISVPTERGAEPSSAALEDVMPLICETIRDTDLRGLVPIVIIESTIQPTWIDTVILPKLHASGLQPGVDVLVGAAPRRDWFSGSEHDLEKLPRVIGGSSEEATELLLALYALVCREIIPARDAHHAAFTKVIENLIRFQGLALGNALSLAFPQYDMTHVLSLASTKWNIPLYHPSMGIGGHCIPLAPRYALAEGGAENEFMTPIHDAVEFNDGYFSRLYAARLRELLQDCRSIVVLGLAYTPDAKMHKLSPALDALDCLKDTPRLRLHDPFYSAEDIDDICGVATLNFPDDLGDCDGILLVTPHTVYRSARIEDVVQPGTVIVDNFGAWRDRRFQAGVRYHEVGRRYVEDARDAIRRPEPSSTVT